MLPFGEAIIVWSLATITASLGGLVLISLLRSVVDQRYVASFGLGIFLWFFVDTIQGSSDLLVNTGFAGGTAQLAAVILFVVGMVVFLRVDRRLFEPDPGTGTPFLVPLVAALALGLHGLGEGSAFGSTAAQTSSSSLLGAFGGEAPGVAYLLHKLFEPMMAGALYVAFSCGSSRSARATARDLVALALVFSLPSTLGAAAGYFVSYDATYLFALGAGASTYVAFRLTRQVFAGPAPSLSPTRVWAALVGGFILIYAAALLHA